MAAPIAFGPYLLLERIGIGARSEVFRARRRDGGAEVALKRVLAGAAGDAHTTGVLLAEAELLAKLEHPGIVQTRDRGSVGEVPYATYDLVAGHDLERVSAALRAGGRKMPLEIAIAIVERIVETLAYLHGYAEAGRAKPILHRDVTASNVLIGVDGSVRLIDFGIAKVEGRNTTTGIGEIKGTVRYMAPEQMLAEELDGRSDLYSVGVILYELASGKILFEGRRPVQILEEVSRAGLPEVTDSALSPDLTALLRKVLAHRRAERYDTAAHLLDALRALPGRLGGLRGADAIVRLMAELFPEPRRNQSGEFHLHESASKSGATLEEPSIMAEEKGGSDLDVFEGLAKKSQRSPSLPGPPPPPGPASTATPLPPPGPPSKAPAPLPPPAGARPPASNKNTLLGVPVPVPPPATSAAATPLPPPPPASKAVPPLPPPTSKPPSVPAPPVSAAPPPKPPATLVAAVAPPPPAAPSIGSALGMPTDKTSSADRAEAVPAALESADEHTPPKGTKSGANVEMDWEDDEESTHVFEKKRHAMLQKSGPRPAAGAPPPVTAPTTPAPVSVPPPASKVAGAAAALLASSGGTASARPVPAPMPPPAPVPAPAPIPPPALPVSAPPPAPVVAPAAPTRMDEPTVVRSRGESSSKLGVILGGLALVAVVALGVFMLLPRTGDLKIELKAKSGNPIAKAEIFVDGQKKCDTTPCKVGDLETGKTTIKVIVEGAPIVEETATVEAGKERVVNITVNDAEAKTTEPVASASASAEPALPEGTGLKLAGPSGVKIYVDGKERGSLPATLTDLSPGEHTIKLDGGERYASEEKKITVTKGKLEDLGDHKPKVIRGKLTLELKTDGAQVVLSSTVDGKKVEKKLADSIWKSPPVSINIDTKDQWKLVATKKGFEDFEKEITFEDGQAETTLAIELTEKGQTPPPAATGPGPVAANPQPKEQPKEQPAAAGGTGTIRINSIPVSKVVLDGRPIGSTPQVVTVSPGPHSVTFIADGKRKSVSVNVVAGKPSTASVKFD